MTFPRTVSCVTLAALCLSGAPKAHADDASMRNAIMAAHARLARADTGGSADKLRQTYQGLTTPDFTFTMPNGRTLSREQFVEAEIHSLPLTRGGQEAFTIQKMTRNGDRVTEDTIRTYRIVMVDSAGRMGPRGKKHVITGRDSFRADWVKTGAAWQARHVQDINLHERIDGRQSAGR